MLLRNDMRGLLYLEPRFLFVLDFRVVPLEDDGIVLFFQRGLVMLRQGGPHNHHGTKAGAQPHGPVLFVRAPGNKVRPGHKVAKAVADDKRMDGVRAFLTVSTVTIHQLATQYLRRKFTDALDHAGVKAFNAIGAVVAFQAVQRGVAQGVQIFAGIFHGGS